MRALRTPEEAFSGLPDFPFAPRYAEIPGGDGSVLRVHYLDEGPPAGETVLLMHGEPSWCFLYRKMIPVLVSHGLRCVAPDLVGFGRSDKPAEQADYSYARHVAWMESLLFDVLQLSGLTLFCQDWGGLVGLRLVAAQPERFARVVAANTGLPDGDQQMSEAFMNWQKFSQSSADFPIGPIVAAGCLSRPPDSVIAAYDAPFPDDSFKSGARIFPALVPTSPGDPAAVDNKHAWEALERFEKPFLTAFSDSDPITSGAERGFQSRVPGAARLRHTTVEGAGHFLQEDKGAVVAGIVAEFVSSTPA